MASLHSAGPEPATPGQWHSLATRAGWDVTVAARLMRVSVRQLERQCQRDLGCTPTEWFQSERMSHAVELLAAGHSVKAVAAQLGYTQAANFSRDFKRHFGRTPRTFVPRPLLGLPFASSAAGQARVLEGKVSG